ncbi:hypothetical protein DPMN_137482 [Dreissena polymorpha]|uniref:Uncharacterized protein n=1 Tax=Dreissena polymorpha TaxID=45954 RepID=A0A9D4JGG0_DREPO|nr:hypothetical protein DPMN_137482 [Dreissena polymorpha]
MKNFRPKRIHGGRVLGGPRGVSLFSDARRQTSEFTTVLVHPCHCLDHDFSRACPGRPVAECPIEAAAAAAAASHRRPSASPAAVLSDAAAARNSRQTSEFTTVLVHPCHCLDHDFSRACPGRPVAECPIEAAAVAGAASHRRPSASPAAVLSDAAAARNSSSCNNKKKTLGAGGH